MVLLEDGVESFLELSRKPKQSSCLIFLSAGIYVCTNTQAGIQISVNMMAGEKFAVFETNHDIPSGAQCFLNVDNEIMLLGPSWLSVKTCLMKEWNRMELNGME